MAVKKIFPPREVENLLGDDYDEFRLGISFRIQAGQVVMQFSDDIQTGRAMCLSRSEKSIATMRWRVSSRCQRKIVCACIRSKADR